MANARRPFRVLTLHRSQSHPRHQPPAAAAGKQSSFKRDPPGGRDPEASHVDRFAARNALGIRARNPREDPGTALGRSHHYLLVVCS
jgi:hypothetical protein